MVIEFVHAHSGTIEIVDGQFAGAHFRIRLPLQQMTAQVKEPRMQPRRVRAGVGCLVALLCGCSLVPGTPERAPPPPAPTADPSLGQMSSYLDMMERLSRATPAEQAETAQGSGKRRK